MARILLTIPLLVTLACTAGRQPQYSNGVPPESEGAQPANTEQPPAAHSGEMTPDQLAATEDEATGDSSPETPRPAENTSVATKKPIKKATPASLIVKSGSRFSVKEAKAILAYHNKVRKSVKAASIYWDVKVAAFAQNWANTLQRRCTMEHRQKNKYGENLWMGTANAYTVVSAAKSWESEKKYYPGGKLNSKNWYRAGHYTQMVWSRSTKLGCGKAICKGTMIVVCNYSPAGNWMGQKPY